METIGRRSFVKLALGFIAVGAVGIPAAQSLAMPIVAPPEQPQSGSAPHHEPAVAEQGDITTISPETVRWRRRRRLRHRRRYWRRRVYLRRRPYWRRRRWRYVNDQIPKNVA